MRRVHPSERVLHGWDVLQLLQFFRAGKLVDVPRVDDTALNHLPLAQLWPTLGNAHAAAVRALNGGVDGTVVG